MATGAFYRLSNQLNVFCGKNKLPHVGADDLLHEDITNNQRTWLYKYIYRWNKAVEKSQRGDNHDASTI